MTSIWKSRVFWPLVTLLASLLVTGFFWRNAQRDVDQALLASFKHRTADFTDRVQRHLVNQSLILKGLAGFFNASDDVTRDDFQRYFSTLKDQMADSGYVAMAYLERVPDVSAPSR